MAKNVPVISHVGKWVSSLSFGLLVHQYQCSLGELGRTMACWHQRNSEKSDKLVLHAQHVDFHIYQGFQIKWSFFVNSQTHHLIPG